MEKSPNTNSTDDTEPTRLPDPPKRTAFRLDKEGSYHHTVTRTDLHLNVIGAMTGRIITDKPNFSEIPKNNSKNAG